MTFIFLYQSTKTARLSDKFSFCLAEIYSLSDKCPVGLRRSQILITDMFYEIETLGIKLVDLGLRPTLKIFLFAV